MTLTPSSLQTLRSSISRPRKAACFAIVHAIRQRGYASSESVPMSLKHEVFVEGDSDPRTSTPLVILHGLFGSKRNWHSLAKGFARKLNRPVYALDLRNHGDSPHGEPMDYSTMSDDVLHFCEQHSLKSIHLLGHSMGGKVAMTLALDQDRPKDLLSSLIVADISPIRGNISPEFQSYVEGMMELEKMGLKHRLEAFDKLAEYEPDVSVRQFLLTNLALTPPHSPLKFKIPLDIISRAIPSLGWFPYDTGEVSWSGPTLFMRGSESNYIKMNHLGLVKEFFPRMSLDTLKASHWLHAEKPVDFLNSIAQFIDRIE